MKSAAIMFCVLLAAVAIAIAYYDRAEITEWIEDLEQKTADLGFWAPFAFFALFFVLTSLFIPDTLLNVSAGALFGTLQGTLVCCSGALVVNSLAFFLSRRYFKEVVSRTVNKSPKLSKIPHVVNHGGVRLQALLRLIPLSPVLLSYLVGTTRSRFVTFFLAFLTMFPIMFVQVYCGYTAKHMVKAAGKPHEHPLQETVLVVAGLIACFLILYIIVRVAKAAIAEAEMEHQDG